MTESELMEIGQALWSNSISLGAIYITLLSGYLFVAYTAGASFNSSQIRIKNTLYIGLSVFVIVSMVAFAINASEVDSIAFSITTQRSLVPTPYMSYAIAFLFIFCLMASLKFMNDVRRK